MRFLSLRVWQDDENNDLLLFLSLRDFLSLHCCNRMLGLLGNGCISCRPSDVFSKPKGCFLPRGLVHVGTLAFLGDVW